MKGTAQSAPIPKSIWEANLNQYPTPGLVSETRPGVLLFAAAVLPSAALLRSSRQPDDVARLSLLPDQS